MNKIKKNKRTVTLKALKTTKAGSLTENDASLNHLNEEFLAPIIKSSITNEISFTKELQYLLRNRVINHDMILDTELKMVKDQYDDILEKKTRANTDEIADESVDKYKILSRFRKAVRKVFIVQKYQKINWNIIGSEKYKNIFNQDASNAYSINEKTSRRKQKNKNFCRKFIITHPKFLI